MGHQETPAERQGPLLIPMPFEKAVEGLIQVRPKGSDGTSEPAPEKTPAKPKKGTRRPRRK